MNSNKTTARVVGLLYLIIAVIAPFSMMYIPSKLIVAGDATATANNIMASESLFRLSFVGDSIVFLIEIVLVVLLYVLFKPVSKTLSLVAAYARLTMTVIQGINLLNHFFVLLLLSGANYLNVFKIDQLHALVLLFLNAHNYVEYIWGIFFGLHLLVLGYLIFKSGFLPKILGVLVMLACFGYLMDSFGIILLPGNKAISIITSVFLVISVIGELSFTFWLLIKGVKKQQPVRLEAG
ncbi:DUF4386 domain-containing protein [bacterium]|nr:DUF4386 domain-containing protein [bacterium]